MARFGRMADGYYPRFFSSSLFDLNSLKDNSSSVFMSGADAKIKKQRGGFSHFYSAFGLIFFQPLLQLFHLIKIGLIRKLEGRFSLREELSSG